MKKILSIALAFIFICFSVNAQEKSRKEIKGDKYAFRYAYDDAIKSYTQAKQLTYEGQRRLAESYHKMGQNIQAEDTYSKLVNSQGQIIPEDYYNYAMVLKINGKYNESNKSMDKFAELKPNDLRAKDYSLNRNDFDNLYNYNSIIKTVFFINTFDSRYFNHIVPGNWSVSDEMVFYLILPFLYFITSLSLIGDNPCICISNLSAADNFDIYFPAIIMNIYFLSQI